METALKFSDKLNSLDLKQISLEKLTELIDGVFHMIPMTRGFIDKGAVLYRARVNKKGKGSFKKFSDFGMAPSKCIEDFGRANEPEERIFYSANNLQLACGEVLQDLKYKFNPNNEFGYTTVSLWEVQRKLHFATLYYSPKVTKFREDIAKFKRKNQDYTKAEKIIKDSIIDVSDIILEFFCEEFAKDNIKSKEDYKISTFYAKRVKETNGFIAPQHDENKFDGIIYPSVAMRYKGDNVALFDTDLDTKIKFKTAFEVVCVDFDFEKADFKSYFKHELKEINKKGELEWNKEVYRPKENRH